MLLDRRGREDLDMVYSIEILEVWNTIVSLKSKRFGKVFLLRKRSESSAFGVCGLRLGL